MAACSPAAVLATGAHLDRAGGDRRTPFKAYFVRECITARRVELLIVLTTNPLETRTLDDLAYLCGAGDSRQECPAGESRHNSS